MEKKLSAFGMAIIITALIIIVGVALAVMLVKDVDDILIWACCAIVAIIIVGFIAYIIFGIGYFITKPEETQQFVNYSMDDIEGVDGNMLDKKERSNRSGYMPPEKRLTALPL